MACSVKSQMVVTITNSDVKRSVQSCTMSKRLMKNMVKASVLNIMFHRMNADPREFVTKKFANIPYKTFKAKSSYPMIRLYHTYMQAYYDAFDKNYLKDMHLYFVDKTTGDIKENYKFSFKYAERENVGGPQTSANVTETTCDLLRALDDLATYEKLDEGTIAEVEFSYHTDVPKEYQPPGFDALELDESLLQKVTKQGNLVEMGELNTGFHVMKCRAKGGIFNNLLCLTGSAMDIDHDCSNPNSIIKTQSPQNPPSKITNDSDDEISRDNRIDMLTEDVEERPQITEDVAEEAKLTEEEIICINSDSVCANPAETSAFSQMPWDVLSSDDDVLPSDCSCSMKQLEIAVDVSKCNGCKKLFHLPCQGYLNKSYLRGAFKCHICSHSDPLMKYESTKTRKNISRYRLVLASLFLYGKVSIDLQETFASLRTTHAYFSAESYFRKFFRWETEMPDFSGIAEFN